MMDKIRIVFVYETDSKNSFEFYDELLKEKNGKQFDIDLTWSVNKLYDFFLEDSKRSIFRGYALGKIVLYVETKVGSKELNLENDKEIILQSLELKSGDKIIMRRFSQDKGLKEGHTINPKVINDINKNLYDKMVKIRAEERLSGSGRVGPF